MKQVFTYDEACTCGVPTGDENHAGDCELWLCPDWQDGRAVWHDGALWDAEELWGWDASDTPTPVELVSDSDVSVHPDLADQLEATVIEEDDAYWCTCFDANDQSVDFFSNHAANCDLRNHEDWMNGNCEWDHQTRTFVYEDTPAPPKKIQQKTNWDDQLYGWGDSVGGYSGALGANTCNHDGETPVVYPNGTLIYPSSSYGFATKRSSYPDYALYLETHRTPVSAAGYIPWKDYGLPEINFQHAAAMIVEAWDMATEGLTVEVGCIGAHGRTGTVLACMAVLAGVPVVDAVEWVRSNHCQKAVENDAQQWWVTWFDAWYHGTEAPPTPPIKPTVPSTTKTQQGTLADHGDDLEAGDSCPKCVAKLVHVDLGGKYVGLACANSKCPNWDGLERCTKCDCYLDAQPLEGYLCWNMHCTSYNLKATSPAGKKLFGKGGRKK